MDIVERCLNARYEINGKVCADAADEITTLREKLRVAEEALSVVADDGGNRKQFDAVVALAKIREVK